MRGSIPDERKRIYGKRGRQLRFELAQDRNYSPGEDIVKEISYFYYDIFFYDINGTLCRL
jgi:hypothetical protein